MNATKFKTFYSLCGKTPLLPITDKIYAKLETTNPTGSIKDRMISYVVNNAIERGLINKNSVLCEATSGNSGISLAAVAASLGLKCIIWMPSNVLNESIERIRMIDSFGAQIKFVRQYDFVEAINQKNKWIDSHKNSWSPNQFENQLNVQCHYETTAREIIEDAKRKNIEIKSVVLGSGTGGTIEGLKKCFQEHNLNIDIWKVVPKEKEHKILGIADGKEFLSNSSGIKGEIIVSSHKAIAKQKEIARNTGLLVGLSSAANLIAAERLSKKYENVFTIFCDRGERYLGKS